ncbi:MAG TPA: stage II sporulation protein D [Desulfotomaculum sp.]|nr:stage II sporulation protein D [Desulfotomaculum sp.]
MRILTGLGLLLAALVIGVGLELNPRVKERVEIRPAGEYVRVYRHATGEVEVLPLEEYVVGVVAAEMPALFPLEALKAQAVAARTYILRRILAGGVSNNPHPGADICDDPRHGQAYLSRVELKRKWGVLGYYRHYFKVRQAVRETAGFVITYNGQLIDPVYHASCGGRTENAGDVWQVDVPYLKSVPCPYDCYPKVVETRSFSVAEVQKALFLVQGVTAATSSANKGLRITLADKTATGRAREIVVNGRSFPATLVRERLNLKSTRLTWTINGDRVTFTTVGHGHGVGLCQYGAKGMAEHGYDFRQILKHYFTGVKIVRY